jgi:hypothetical protein
MAAARESFGKLPATMDTHAKEERCFLRAQCRDIISKGQGQSLISYQLKVRL